MITEHDYYNEKAIKNQTRSTNLTATRGVIYDANMNVLASSSTVETVFIDPNEIAEQMKQPENSNLLDQIARGLGEILDVEPSFVYEQAADKQYRYKVIKRKISEELADESAPSSAKTASPACISRRISSAIIPIPPSPRRRSASSRATTTALRVSRPTTTKSSPAPPARSSPPRATTAPRCSIHMRSITTPPTAAASSPPSTRPSRPTSRKTCRTPSISTTSKTARSASSWTSTRARSRPWPRSAPTIPTTIWRSTTTRPPFCSKRAGGGPRPA